MNKILNNVIHFQGSEVTWKNNIINGSWADSIVFGVITDSTGKKSKRFYGGRNSRFTDFEYTHSITVDSKAAAQLMVSDNNLGLLITVISETNLGENGTYLVTYNVDNELELLKIGEGGKSTTTDTVTSAKTVGYIQKGDEIPAGKTLQDIVNMIFTKILGLKSTSTSPSASLSGITSKTYEVNDTINSITLTASYTDGHWNNEEDWKNSYSGNKTYQDFGTSALTYQFSGMTSRDASTLNTITITDYKVNKGTQKVTVKISHSDSTYIPVNQNGIQLTEGNVNNSTTYVPYDSSTVSANSGVITGDYRYWIGYTPKIATEIQREDVFGSSSTGKHASGWAGSRVASESQYNTPQNNYVTFIVPDGMTLKKVEDPFNNSVVSRYTKYDNILLGIEQTDKYTIYQEYAVAEVGLERKNIILE